MAPYREVLNKTVREVIQGIVGYREAAEVVGVSHRTIHNYVKRFLDRGTEGLLDRRRGHFHKLTIDQEARIVACKRERPHRSARWIRDHLKLSVSAETVRLVLVKHHLNRISKPPVKWVLAPESRKQCKFKDPNAMWLSERPNTMAANDKESHP